jgi:hypothetical protein
MNTFLMVIAIITNQGTLDMRVYQLAECPDEKEFVQEMEKLKDSGAFIDWKAQCTLGPKRGSV